MCPFLRNIRESTNFSFSAPALFPPPVKGNQGPIFEDGPNFELAFNLFHGHNGVVPLSGRAELAGRDLTLNPSDSEATNMKFHPLAASAAAISLSAFGASGPFGFDAFMSKRVKVKGNNEAKRKERQSEKKPPSSDHEALSNEWLRTGNCPIAKSFRAVSGVLPLVAKMLQPPPGLKVRCPPAIVAARAALARTAAVKSLRPQPLPTKVLAIGLLGMAINVPLGIWREHTKKFSPAWFTAVHASVPFIGMLRKAVKMPKYAMAFTIAASILGQVIGSRAERKRMELLHVKADGCLQKIGPEIVDKPVSLLSIEERGLLEVYTATNERQVPCSQQYGNETWNAFNKINSSTVPVGAFAS